VVYLTNIVRLDGSAYLPELVQRVIQKYSFLKFPTVEEIQKDTQNFAVGKFNGIQINELNVYSDGVIASGRCSTTILRDFVSDLFDMVEKDFGYTESKVLDPELHFESSIVVRSSKDLGVVIAPPQKAMDVIEEALGRFTKHSYQPAGIQFDTDTKASLLRRRTIRFSVERRLGIPFDKNVFYSQAPLRTDDHLDLLGSLESLAN
jgi:hypothetical protein